MPMTLKQAINMTVKDLEEIYAGQGSWEFAGYDGDLEMNAYVRIVEPGGEETEFRVSHVVSMPNYTMATFGIFDEDELLQHIESEMGKTYDGDYVKAFNDYLEYRSFDLGDYADTKSYWGNIEWLHEELIEELKEWKRLWSDDDVEEIEVYIN